MAELIGTSIGRNTSIFYGVSLHLRVSGSAPLRVPDSLYRRSLALAVSLSLLLQALPPSAVWAAKKPDEKAPLAAPVVVPAPAKEPLIEVSVDSLEISETNGNTLGFLWGDANNPGTNEFNFFEKAVPSLFSVGQFNRLQLVSKLSALVKTNQVRILANPTLLTKSGFEASFLVGGEIPYPQVGQGGVSGIDYKKYGVNLKILPQLTPQQTIDAQINVSVSNPDPSVGQNFANVGFIPGLASREASTKVSVKDGDTVVMAGIKQSRREKVITRVPVLSYIPILGLLFRHKDEKVTQTSLVLFVTFRLIKS